MPDHRTYRLIDRLLDLATVAIAVLVVYLAITAISPYQFLRGDELDILLLYDGSGGSENDALWQATILLIAGRRCVSTLVLAGVSLVFSFITYRVKQEVWRIIVRVVVFVFTFQALLVFFPMLTLLIHSGIDMSVIL